MSRVFFRQIATGSRLLAIGNFFREVKPDAQWRLAALFEKHGKMELQRFGLEMSCVLGVGRQYTGEESSPYRSRGFQKRLVVPPVETWQEKPLGECARLARRLATDPELAGQHCFVFEADGLTVWLPKFELARKLFFHATFLVRAAFEPNGLDMVFTKFNEGGDIHFHTPEKTGAPSQLLKLKGYRDHFSWLLLEQDVRNSFDSIWQRLNEEQTSAGSKYARWRFNFLPPSSLSGVNIVAQGPFDEGSNELLVWEITSLHGLRFGHTGDIFFHHPALRSAGKSEGSGCVPLASGTDEIEVDADEDPNETGERRLIALPVEGLTFDSLLATKIAYNGETATRHGKKVDDEPSSGGRSRLLGVADPVAGGTIASGDFQQLGESGNQEQYANRFRQLREIIKQIAEGSDIELLDLDVNLLPKVPRCSYHMIDEETPRCYLMARIRLNTGVERYLLEIDTSDNRKTMSTRIMGFKTGVDVKKSIARILQDTVKGSLRWPSTMAKDCEPLHSVHHPKEGPSDAYLARVSGWKQRIRACLR